MESGSKIQCVEAYDLSSANGKKHIFYCHYGDLETSLKKKREKKNGWPWEWAHCPKRLVSNLSATLIMSWLPRKRCGNVFLVFSTIVCILITIVNYNVLKELPTNSNSWSKTIVQGLWSVKYALCKCMATRCGHQILICNCMVRFTHYIVI